MAYMCLLFHWSSHTDIAEDTGSSEEMSNESDASGSSEERSNELSYAQMSSNESSDSDADSGMF